MYSLKLCTYAAMTQHSFVHDYIYHIVIDSTFTKKQREIFMGINIFIKYHNGHSLLLHEILNILRYGLSR